jgi:hypothetical protein
MSITRDTPRARTARRVPLPLLVLAAFVTGLAGCSSLRTLTIRELLDDAARYNGATVRIRGQVTENIGLQGAGAYRLSDDTGTITVITMEGGAPSKGTEVAVQGRFRSAFTLGTNNAAVIVESGRSKR